MDKNKTSRQARYNFFRILTISVVITTILMILRYYNGKIAFITAIVAVLETGLIIAAGFTTCLATIVSIASHKESPNEERRKEQLNHMGTITPNEKTAILTTIGALVKGLRYGGQVVTVESVQQAIAGDASFPMAGIERIPDVWIVPFIIHKPTRQEINADLLEDLRRELTEAMRLTECKDHDFEAMLRSIMLDLEILAMKYNSILKAFHPTAETDQ